MAIECEVCGNPTTFGTIMDRGKWRCENCVDRKLLARYPNGLKEVEAHKRGQERARKNFKLKGGPQNESNNPAAAAGGSPEPQSSGGTSTAKA